jgi:hypothetical protein
VFPAVETSRLMYFRSISASVVRRSTRLVHQGHVFAFLSPAVSVPLVSRTCRTSHIPSASRLLDFV